MKLFLLFAVIISAVYAKVAETEAEKYECIANFLKSKNLLDKHFKYVPQFNQLECGTIVTNLKDIIIDETLERISESSTDEESEESRNMRNLYHDNSACIRGQLNSIGYSDLMMKIYVYQHSKRTSNSQKKKLTSATEAEATKKLAIAVSLCMSEQVFGELFDNLMKNESEEVETLEEKQNDYCIRKYVIDKKLIDTDKFPVTINPDNIELNFACASRIDSIFEDLKKIIQDGFEIPGQSRKQARCLSRAIKSENGMEYIAKISVLSEIQMTDDLRKELRSEFVQTIKKLHMQMIKCI